MGLDGSTAAIYQTFAKRIAVVVDAGIDAIMRPENDFYCHYNVLKE